MDLQCTQQVVVEAALRPALVPQVHFMQEVQVVHVTARRLVVVLLVDRPQAQPEVPEHPEEPPVLQDSVVVEAHLTPEQVTEATAEVVEDMAPVVAEVEALSRQAVQAAQALQGTAW